MKRRSFLKVVGSATSGAALAPQNMLGMAPAVDEVQRVAGLPHRVLGRTGQRISVVGFPGLALTHYEQEECTAGLHAALERGVNYFDVAPAYGKGVCETRMGIGLEGVERSRYFLSCKTKARDKAGAREELERSLKLLKTDQFDLYQLHCLRRPEEVEEALGPDGAIRTLLEARERGQVKYLGFSAHTTKAAVAAMRGFRFDTAMFPINFVELLGFGIGREVLEVAQEQEVAVLAMKALARGAWPKGAERTRKWWYRATEEQAEADLAVRFALSQPGVAAVIPPSFLDLVEKAVVAARGYRPIMAAEVEQLTGIARSCESMFEKEEARVAWHRAARGPLYPDSPHEGGCEHWA